MKPYPTPTQPGHYWAKLITPTRMPVGDDWRSVDWEVVQVFINDGPGFENDPEYFGVAVPGIGPSQWLPDFVWGPPVKKPEELR